MLTTVAVIAAAAFNWSWLLATGVAPLLLTLLPCAVMCVLGLCMHRSANGSCQASPQVAPTRAPQDHTEGRSA
jgi:hypothetical protein